MMHNKSINLIKCKQAKTAISFFLKVSKLLKSSKFTKFCSNELYLTRHVIYCTDLRAKLANFSEECLVIGEVK